MLLTKQKKGYSSLENALRLLDLYSLENSEFKVNEIAEYLNIANSTAHRLLRTLEGEGFIVKDMITNHYRLGISILSLGSVITSSHNVIKKSTDILKSLSDKYNETAQLGILQNNYVFYVNRIDYEHPILGLQMYYADRKAPLHCTSSGKILLAQEDKSTITNYMKNNLQQFTRSTIINPSKLTRELNDIFERDYAICVDEYLMGVCSLAVPVKNPQGKIIASLELIRSSEGLRTMEMGDIISVLHNKSEKLTNQLI